jgi:hypothetical protein
MSCVVFTCNFLLISHYGKIFEEDIFVDRVALDMAFKELTKNFCKKEKNNSPNRDSQSKEAD